MKLERKEADWDRRWLGSVWLGSSILSLHFPVLLPLPLVIPSHCQPINPVVSACFVFSLSILPPLHRRPVFLEDRPHNSLLRTDIFTHRPFFIISSSLISIPGHFRLEPTSLERQASLPPISRLSLMNSWWIVRATAEYSAPVWLNHPEGPYFLYIGLVVSHVWKCFKFWKTKSRPHWSDFLVWWLILL